MDAGKRGNRNTSEGNTMKEITKSDYGFEHFDLSLSGIIKIFIDDCLTHKDWEVVAIDVVHDKVVLKRYVNATPKI